MRYANAKDMAQVISGIELPEKTAGGDGGRTAKAREKVNIQADEGTNALIMTGPPAAIQDLQGVVRQLDIRRVQLMIEAVIAEVLHQ
ncbi:MAG: secretin N-terminal domain-containing protein [Desulfurivibrio sp.]|nr:secretin N-terminal domain-containing protein [Desulfurivibrio sp.]